MECNIYDYREYTDTNGYPLYDTPDDNEVVTLFYDTDKGKFIDEDGVIVWNIFSYITPNDLYLFRKNKECMFVPHRSFRDTLCELYYPTEDDDDENTYVESIYYDKECNVFYDEYGVEIDIYELLPPSEINHNKKVGGTLYVPSPANPHIMFEIVFPIEEEDYEN